MAIQSIFKTAGNSKGNGQVHKCVGIFKQNYGSLSIID